MGGVKIIRNYTPFVLFFFLCSFTDLNASSFCMNCLEWRYVGNHLSLMYVCVWEGGGGGGGGVC